MIPYAARTGKLRDLAMYDPAGRHFFCAAEVREAVADARFRRQQNQSLADHPSSETEAGAQEGPRRVKNGPGWLAVALDGAPMVPAEDRY
jgi:hypothetical protein